MARLQKYRSRKSRKKHFKNIASRFAAQMVIYHQVNSIMKFQFWSIGKTHEPYVKSGVEDFTKRISNYFKVEWNIIPVPKNAGMLE